MRVDKSTTPDSIANTFADLYIKLYNRDSPHSLDDVVIKLNRRIRTENFTNLNSITNVEVDLAIRSLKPLKSDAFFDVSSNHYILARQVIVPTVTRIIKALLVHGRLPAILTICQFVPILKNRFGSRADSSNYRAIANGCLFLKIIELLLMRFEADHLKLSDLQFAYQEKVSTTTCSWAVQTVVNYFNRRARPVYAASLNMTKAFDNVNWVKLMATLEERSVDPVFLRLMCSLYSSQECSVCWDGSISKRFSVTNGIRQGSVCSGLLFTIYIDCIIPAIKSSNIGCKIGSVFLGVMIYADDILLLSASSKGLQAMLSICQQHSSKLDLSFGTAKSLCVLFAKRKRRTPPPTMYLYGKPLPWTKGAKHLGVFLENNSSFTRDMSEKRLKFIGLCHSLIQEFPKGTPDLMMKLVNIYATGCLHSSQLWNFNCSQFTQLLRTWNKLIRRFYKLKFWTHRWLLSVLCKFTHLEGILAGNFLGFVQNLRSSEKPPIAFLYNVAIHDRRSDISSNLKWLQDKTKTDINIILDFSAKQLKADRIYQPITTTVQHSVAAVVSELQQVLNDDSTISCMDKQDARSLFNHLCTTEEYY